MSTPHKAKTSADNNARRNYVEEQWNRFKSKVLQIPPDATKDEIEAIRQIFYSGCWAMILMIVENNHAKLNDVREEMGAFMAEVEDRLGKRWRDEVGKTYVAKAARPS